MLKLKHLHLIMCHLTLPYPVFPYLNSPHLNYLTSSHATFPHATLSHTTSPYPTPLHPTLPHLTSHHLISCNLTPPHLNPCYPTSCHLISHSQTSCSHQRGDDALSPGRPGPGHMPALPTGGDHQDPARERADGLGHLWWPHHLWVNFKFKFIIPLEEMLTVVCTRAERLIAFAIIS